MWNWFKTWYLSLPNWGCFVFGCCFGGVVFEIVYWLIRWLS